MQSNPQEKDVIILGAGPAGLSAGIWCEDLGLDYLILEAQDLPGGQLNWIFNQIENYPGGTYADGSEIKKAFVDAAPKVVSKILTNASPKHIDLAQKKVTLESGRKIKAKFIIIATGIRRSRLGVPGEDNFEDRGLLRSGKKDLEIVAGETVCVIGGGDAAVENALILSESAKKVVLIHRRETFAARHDFIDRIGQTGNIEIVRNTIVEAFVGNDHLEEIRIRNVVSGKETRIGSRYALIRIGVAPNSDSFKGQIKLDDRGYIVVDQLCRTSVEGVYAVGDVANRVAPTIATAVGTAATAVKCILSDGQ